VRRARSWRRREHREQVQAEITGRSSKHAVSLGLPEEAGSEPRNRACARSGWAGPRRVAHERRGEPRRPAHGTQRRLARARPLLTSSRSQLALESEREHGARRSTRRAPRRRRRQAAGATLQGRVSRAVRPRARGGRPQPHRERAARAAHARRASSKAARLRARSDREDQARCQKRWRCVRGRLNCGGARRNAGEG